jgi:hypothetical protein
MPKRKRKPSYLLHKPTNQARVRIDGKDHYLGEYGSQESKERYQDILAEWLAESEDRSPSSLTVDELALLYLKHAGEYYRKGGAANVRSRPDQDCFEAPCQSLRPVPCESFWAEVLSESPAVDDRCRLRPHIDQHSHGANPADVQVGHLRGTRFRERADPVAICCGIEGRTMRRKGIAARELKKSLLHQAFSGQL